ncbi:putative cuticle collagen 80 [Poecile atricapillus]|uniref:putative cuticle collagen 80 n=1 Tax=Poecile atricapillus TaxID=48891 RepID=UPI002739EDAC|nr:putative cuticle collagen 80 [Poecile atricapillus]
MAGGAAVPDRGPAPPGAPRPSSSSSAPPHPRGWAEPLPPGPPPRASRPFAGAGSQPSRKGSSVGLGTADWGQRTGEILSGCSQGAPSGGPGAPAARAAGTSVPQEHFALTICSARMKTHHGLSGPANPAKPCRSPILLYRLLCALPQRT